MVKDLSTLLFLIFLVSCSSLERKNVEKLQNLLKNGDLKDAKNFALSENFYKSKNSEILRYLERGTLLHYGGSFKESAQNLAKALELSKELFTVSISKKFGAQIVGDSKDNYYPKQYENSLIRFYLALDFLCLSEEENDIKIKSDYLLKAKAVLLEWDAFQTNLAQARAGTPLFKRDILSNILGPIVHFKLKSKTDDQTARTLIENAKNLFFINSNMYPIFNYKHHFFLKDFKNLHELDRAIVEKKYVESTTHAQNLLKYLKESSQSKKMKAHKVLIHESWITPIRAKKYHIPLFSSGSYDTNFLFFAGLMLNNGGYYPSISYELPEIPLVENQGQRYLVIKKENKEIKKLSLALVAPLSDISHRTFEDEVLSHNLKVGARIVAKYIAALTSTYAVYANTKKSSGNDLMAQLVAGGIFSGLARGIQESEKADLRKWISLPQNILVANISLPEGEYDLFFEKENSPTQVYIGKININNEHLGLYNFRVP